MTICQNSKYKWKTIRKSLPRAIRRGNCLWKSEKELTYAFLQRPEIMCKNDFLRNIFEAMNRISSPLLLSR